MKTKRFHALIINTIIEFQIYKKRVNISLQKENPTFKKRIDSFIVKFYE